MEITLLGGTSVTAHYRDFEIVTDQPPHNGGKGRAPSPFDLFLASLGTCAAYYIQDFCTVRGIRTEGIKVTQQWHRDPATKLISRIEQTIHLPRDFPDRYEKAVVRAAGVCTVKRHLEAPPEFEISISRAVPTPS